MLADGNPAETRTLNKVGLERNGVSKRKGRVGTRRSDSSSAKVCR